VNAAPAPTDDAPAVIVVWDVDLGMALEMSLNGAGFGALLPDAAADLAELPLRSRSPLIICADMLPKNPRAMIAAMRAGGWRGLGVVVTQNAEPWARRFEPEDRFHVLEMPFMSHDLIGMIVSDGVACEATAKTALPNQLILGCPGTMPASA